MTNDLPAPPPVGPKGRYHSYAEMVAEMDERVGRVLDSIAELGLQERTIVIYMTDNGAPRRSILDAEDGEFIFEDVLSRLADGRAVPGGKGQFTDGGIRVPLMIRWPGRFRASGVVHDLVDASDLMPTLAELTGARLPSEVTLDGRSFAPCLTHGKPGSRSWVYASHERRWALRDARFKLYSDGRFFDAEQDVDETAALDIHSLSGEAAKSYSQLKAVGRALREEPSVTLDKDRR